MRNRQVKTDIAFILLGSFLMSLPQLLGRGMIIGSDAVFHFNRFYDTAMQMAEGNVQYFISMYSFQESGRIVNALYGPITAYLQGLLVLLVNSWYHYQLLANFILFLLSGCSMYYFLKKGEIASRLRLPVAIIYMTTYSIQYWTIRQGFSSWGAALLPLCLIPFIEMITSHKIKPLQLGICTALMVQTHLFSSLLLVLIYLPAFIYAFSKTRDRKRLVINLCLAGMIFFSLTANMWFGFLELYGRNEILAPFVNATMSLNTINVNSSYWLFNPVSLIFILVFELYQAVRRGKGYKALHKITLGTGVAFLILATSLVPWTELVQQGNSLAQMIQFPFRFFIPATILFLFSFCMTLQEKESTLPKYLSGVAIASVVQVLVLISLSMYQWHHSDSFLLSGVHTTVQTTDAEELRASFFGSDLSKSLQLVEKATPDYLPVYGVSEENKYRLYQAEIIERNSYFKKEVKNKKLMVSWQGKGREMMQVPVIKYAGTQLILNGDLLADDHIQLSNIGTVGLFQEEGKNTLEVSYREHVSFNLVLAVTLFSWGFSIIKLLVGKSP